MANLFKRLAYFTDIHYGRSANSPVFIEDNNKFIDWFIEGAQRRGCDTFIFGGDFFDNRNSIGLNTLHHAYSALQKINDSFDQSFFILGNHDLYLRSDRSISSVVVAGSFPKIKIISDPLTVGDVSFLPWLVGEEYKKLKNLKSRYVFSHLEVPGFLMNAMVEMPMSDHGVRMENFASHEYIFSGHFHMRQQKENMIYTGNVMPFNFSDNWQEDRGAMFLDWGESPEFMAWPNQPCFRTMKLSEMLNEPDKFLKRGLTARVSLDIDISYEEAQIVKETFIDQYGLRKIELVHAQKTEQLQEFTGDVVFQSVDQIVIDGLLSVQSVGMKPEALVEIYRNLGS